MRSIASIHPADLIGEETAGMREADLQTGQLIHQPAEQQSHGRYGRVGRKADQIVQEVVAESVWRDGDKAGMEQHENVELPDAFSQRTEFRSAEIPAVDVR